MPKATYVQPGHLIDYTPGSALNAGDVVDLGTFIGVATHPIAANALGALAIRGTFDIAKDSNAINLGANVYWFVSAGYASATSTSADATIGKCVQAAQAGDATVRVTLCPGQSLP